MVDSMSIRPEKVKVKQRSHVKLPVTILSESSPQAPSTLEYRVYNETHGQLIRDWTSIAPDSDVTLDLSPLDMDVLHGRSVSERVRVTLCANRGINFQVVGSVVFVVEREVSAPDRGVIEYLLDQRGGFIMDQSYQRIAA